MPPVCDPLPFPPPDPSRAAERRGSVLVFWGLGVFVLALAWSLSQALATKSIGPSDEHFTIGRRLYRTGSLAGENDPGVLRPPGYPAFVAATLHLRDAFAAARGLARGEAGGDEDAVLLAQCLLLAAATSVIFAFSMVVLPPFEAACAGLAFACGPIALTLVGLHSYHLLHIFWLAVGTAHLAFAIKHGGGSPLNPLLAGVLWGVATLVRPVSLILPPFVFLLARLRRGGAWRSATGFTVLFMLGMAATILPYTVRNYRITGRLILVNAQGWSTLWGSTVRKVQPHEDFLSWGTIWRDHGLIIYRRVTGDSKYDLATFSAHALELEDAFKREALGSFERRPSVYVHNVAANLWRFSRDPAAKWPRDFAVQNGLPAAQSLSVIKAYSLGLLLVALPGVILGLFRRDASAWTIFLVFSALATAHAITFMTGRYTYVKLPLLSMASAITLAAIEDRSIVLPGTRIRLRLASMLVVTTLLCSASATALLLAR